MGDDMTEYQPTTLAQLNQLLYFSPYYQSYPFSDSNEGKPQAISIQRPASQSAQQAIEPYQIDGGYNYQTPEAETSLAKTDPNMAYNVGRLGAGIADTVAGTASWSNPATAMGLSMAGAPTSLAQFAGGMTPVSSILGMYNTAASTVNGLSDKLGYKTDIPVLNPGQMIMDALMNDILSEAGVHKLEDDDYWSSYDNLVNRMTDTRSTLKKLGDYIGVADVGSYSGTGDYIGGTGDRDNGFGGTGLEDGMTGSALGFGDMVA